MTAGAGVDDAALAIRAGAGDQAAFAELVRRHKTPVYRLARRLLGDPEEAYDVAQETFVAAWGALGRYDPRRPFGAWLRTIALNKARDRGRRMAVRRLIFSRRPPDEVEQVAADPEGVDGERRLAARQELDALDRAIARLPRALKEPLVLTVLEGLPQKEAAALLGVSVKAVETRVHRARKLLATALRPDAGD